MADDFANQWGALYVILEQTRRPPKRKAIDICCTTSDRTAETELRSIIQQMTRSYFSLEKLTPNGSDANLFAITSLSKGDTTGVLIGCGSYVSGDLGPLQSWSTSDFQINEGPSFIRTPDNDEVSIAAKYRTIALPYHIPGTLKTHQLQSYEDICLRLLHQRCVYQRSIDKPVTVLFLELLLASNGCLLSDHFLEKVALLSRHHEFGIIVDEILTGGRTPSMLLTMEKPKNFLERVAYVTLGKWCKCGIVLSGLHHDRELERSKQLLDARGVTTAIMCREPLPYFRMLQSLIHKIPERRAKSVSKIASISSEDTWGVGLIIFIPRRCVGTRMGTHNRLLPLLNETPAASIPTVSESRWTKATVSRNTIKCVMRWTQSPFFIQSTYDFETKLHCLYAMIEHLVIHHFTDNWVTTSHIHNTVTKSVLTEEVGTQRVSTNLLRTLERAGYLKKQQKTTHRLQGWTIIDSRLYCPWIQSAIGVNHNTHLNLE